VVDVLKNKDVLLGAVTSLLGVAYIWQTIQLPAGDHVLNSSRSFPLLLAILLLVVSFLLLIKAVRSKGVPTFTRIDIGRLQRGGFYLLWTGLYIFLGIPFLGFAGATVPYLIIGILFYKEVRWYQAVPVSLGAVFLFYYVFSQLMYIKLP
jgi:putative tricarboxylic transport membrane protein